MPNAVYFANPTSERARQLMADGVIGYIDTPNQGNIRPPGLVWCADNGCFGKGYVEGKWLRWLENNAPDARRCVFATAPDVVGDPVATWRRAAPWLPRIRALGYPAALVAQDGLTPAETPWDEFDALFIGGHPASQWKLGTAARRLVEAGLERGKHVHMGRVNSGKRYYYADAIGCHSVDGTRLKFHPADTVRDLEHWVATLRDQKPLFELPAATT